MAQAPEWVIAGVLVAETLERLGVPYIFAGSVASIIHGEIRTTFDAEPAPPARGLRGGRCRSTCAESVHAKVKRLL